MPRHRYLANPFVSQGSGPVELSQEQLWAHAAALLPQLEQSAARGAVPKSTGKLSRDYSVYTGLGGVALTYLRLGDYSQHVRGDARAATMYFQKARDIAAACLAGDPNSDTVSFFCGTPGYLAILCAASALMGDAASASSNLSAILRWVEAAEQHSEDELLFGRAGYLYALLWARKHCADRGKSVNSALQRVAESLVASGQARAARSYTEWPLMWHCFDEPYMGAAHGVVGVLALLFHCYELLSAQSQALVTATLDRLLAVRFDSGNVPIILGERSDEHVHWCHGAPGLPALAAVAADKLGDSSTRFRTAAVKAADVVWERGIILKGNGLCHGIAGNGYTFLSLYRLTGDRAYLLKAHAFATLLHHAPLQQLIAQQPDPQRRVQGVPDSPSSLMEGSAGVICFLLDLCRPEGAAFPAWEL
eukprot:TRINITY_DN27389_c0_g1_i2.p1 TRINITY_DN27389_c0_g1~~TRINITY_DN27389_c0_g1_i2.p1  ORF type:complete len:420 (-),score=43.18 TRINITY_DN27389_c0_g1_i2:68-1327(-)